MLIASLTITVVDLNEVAFMSVLIMATVSMDDPNPPKILISRLRAKKYSSGSKYTALQKMFTTVLINFSFNTSASEKRSTMTRIS